MEALNKSRGFNVFFRDKLNIKYEELIGDPLSTHLEGQLFTTLNSALYFELFIKLDNIFRKEVRWKLDYDLYTTETI